MPRTFTLMLIDLMPAWCIAIKLREKSGGGAGGGGGASWNASFQLRRTPGRVEIRFKVLFSISFHIGWNAGRPAKSSETAEQPAEDGPERNCSISQLVALADSQGFIVNGRDYSITAASTLNRKR